MEWLHESWPLVVAGATALAGIIFGLQATYAAERDRQALKLAGLEREKLALEVARLRNDPAVVAERRAIYDRLRLLVNQITANANATLDHVSSIHSIRHDAEYRFSPEIVASIKDLIPHVVMLHITRELRSDTWSHDPGNAARIFAHNESSLAAILSYEETLIERFRPALSL
jgi:hypothetical protein